MTTREVHAKTTVSTFSATMYLELLAVCSTSIYALHFAVVQVNLLGGVKNACLWTQYAIRTYRGNEKESKFFLFYFSSSLLLPRMTRRRFLPSSVFFWTSRVLTLIGLLLDKPWSQVSPRGTCLHLLSRIGSTPAFSLHCSSISL